MTDEPNYDSRLDPRVRRRSLEEIDEIISDKYRKFLRLKLLEEGVESIMARLSTNSRESIIDDMIEACVEDSLFRRKYEREFLKIVDVETLQWEEK